MSLPSRDQTSLGKYRVIAELGHGGMADVYLAVMRQAGTYNYSQPATLFTLSDIGLSVHRYHGRLDAFAQALEGGKALEGVQVELLGDKGQVLAKLDPQLFQASLEQARANDLSARSNLVRNQALPGTRTSS